VETSSTSIEDVPEKNRSELTTGEGSRRRPGHALQQLFTLTQCEVWQQRHHPEPCRQAFPPEPTVR
jgi:hypothetical protein